MTDIKSPEIVKGKVYSFPVLRPTKGKENSEGKTAYSFDISKAYQIFNSLLKDKKIQLIDCNTIPPPEEQKGKKYCKWHNSCNHATSNCIVIRKAIQKAIKEGRFITVDKAYQK